MYFWRIEQLKDQLIARPLSDREALPYLLVFVGLTAALGFIPGEGLNVWDHVGHWPQYDSHGSRYIVGLPSEWGRSWPLLFAAVSGGGLGHRHSLGSGLGSLFSSRFISCSRSSASSQTLLPGTRPRLSQPPNWCCTGELAAMLNTSHHAPSRPDNSGAQLAHQAARMALHLHHAFVFTAVGAPEAEGLLNAGLVEGSPNTHPGQGTANRRIFFERGFLELFWVHDEHEAQSPLTAPTKLWDRWAGRGRTANPFGICLSSADGVDSNLPFPTWAYRPKLLV